MLPVGSSRSRTPRSAASTGDPARDASVIPTIPSRNPNPAVLMIGGKGSDLLLDDSLVQLMERQHQSVADLIAVIEPAPDRWASTADATGQTLITSRLRMLAGTVLEDAEQSWFSSVMPPPARLLW